MILFDVGNGLILGLEILAPTVARHVIPCGPSAVFVLKVATTANKQRIVESNSALLKLAGLASMILLDGISSAAQQFTGKNVLSFILFLLYGLEYHFPDIRKMIKRLKFVADANLMSGTDEFWQICIKCMIWEACQFVVSSGRKRDAKDS